ncbi:MAG TPA: hypothetical protein VGN57_16170 [Pirellulaceae bacterium]|jgi:hypothetical protein|nr:hypothetical protein [Pirellulaceae bacterium]
MAHRLIDRNTPFWKRLYLAPYQFLASLGLAVPLIFILAGTLALGTLVEAAFGTPASQFFVYRSWWFNLLIAFLAINIFCAAAIRFPWKRHQTGFVITHIGLLTLIFSALISRLYGIDAQMPVFEGDSSHWAQNDDFLFEIAIRDESGQAASQVPHSLRFFGMNWVGVTACVLTLLFVVGSIAAAGIYASRRKDYRYLFGSLGLSGLMLLAMGVWVAMHYAYARQELPIAQSPGTRIERVKFSPGPMSWEDLDQFSPFSGRATAKHLTYAPAFWVSMRDRAGETLYDRDGIKLEVLDYLADSEQAVLPRLNLRMTAPAAKKVDAQGRSVEAEPTWTPIDGLSPEISPNAEQFPVGLPKREQVGGGVFVFGLAANEAEEQAFLANKPNGPLGDQGQVVLSIGGKTHRFQVSEHADGEKFDLGDGWQARIANYYPTAQPTELSAMQKGQPMAAQPNAEVTQPFLPAVEVELFKGADAEQPTAELTLFAVTSNANLQAHGEEIYGAYWFDQSSMTSEERQQLGVARIEFLQGHRKSATEPFELFYRYWNGSKIVSSGQLPLDGSKEDAVDAFVMPIATLKMYVDSYQGADVAETTMIGLPFEREITRVHFPAAKVRLTVDGESEEFWIQSHLGAPDEEPPLESQVHFVAGDDRLVSLKMPIDMFDIGFRVYLQDFERRLDPGTSQPSHYSSAVTFLDRDVQRGLFTQPATGGEPTFRRLPDAELVSDVAFDSDGSLFWSEEKTGRIGKVQAKSGDVTLLLRDATRRPQYLAVSDDGSQVVWVENLATSGGIRSSIQVASVEELLEAATGRTELAPKRIYEQLAGIGDVAVHGEDVYFISQAPNANAIGKAKLDGSTSDPVWNFPLENPVDIAIDQEAGELYWIEGADGSILQRSLEAKESSVVYEAEPYRHPVGLAVDAANGRLVWTEEDRSPRVLVEANSQKWEPLRSSVRSLPLDDLAGEAQTLADRNIDVPGQIAAASGEIAWIQRPSSRQDVWITMNAPVEMVDPVHGRSFRVFQESFFGPFVPGEQEYERRVANDESPTDLYSSTLTVNHDPGRGIRNLGCLLVVLGIVVMFYMRAYFFKPKPKAGAADRTAASTTPTARKQERKAREPVGA